MDKRPVTSHRSASRLSPGFGLLGEFRSSELNRAVIGLAGACVVVGLSSAPPAGLGNPSDNRMSSSDTESSLGDSQKFQDSKLSTLSTSEPRPALFSPLGFESIAPGTFEKEPFPPGKRAGGRLSMTASGTDFGDGFRPEDAHLRMGFLSLRIPSASAGVLYTDNANFSLTRQEAGVIGFIRASIASQIELAPNLQLAAGASAIYLPLENQIGLSANNAWGLAVPSQLARVQIAYELPIGYWDTQFYELLRVGSGLRSIGFSTLSEGSEEHRIKRYSYGVNGVASPYGQNRFESGFIVLENRVGAEASRLLPTVTQLTLGGSHSDYLYPGSEREAALPTSREEVHVRLSSERQTLRFKPYLNYQASRYEDGMSKANFDGDWASQATVGMEGPATERLDLQGEVGYFWGNGLARGGLTYQGRARHWINPDTTHEVLFRRTLTEPVRDLSTEYQYRLNKQLNSNLDGSAFISYTIYENLDGLQNNSREWGAGVRLTMKPSSLVDMGMSQEFARYTYLGVPSRDDNVWLTRLELRRDRWSLQLIYQHHSQSLVESAGIKTAENVGTVLVTRYF